MRVYIGTSTDPGSAGAGIYRCDWDAGSGKLSAPEMAVRTRRPSFLALHPSGKFVLACNEIDDLHGSRQGGVSAFAIGGNGGLELINEQPSGGAGPAFVEVDPTGQCVLVANYASGSVAALPIDAHSGRLSAPSAVVQHHGSGPNKERQSGPHAHSIRVAPTASGAATRFALACDLGLDKVFVLRLDALRGTLEANQPPFARVAPGAGPRHTAFSRDGRFVYVINEMGSSVTVFAWDAVGGLLREMQTVSTLPPGFQGKTKAAEVAVHQSGRFLYASNRGFDSIARFAVDPSTGQLTPAAITPSGGGFPRHFAIDPAGQWLVTANMHSNCLVVFRIDQETGELSEVQVSAEAPSPTCVLFGPAD